MMTLDTVFVTWLFGLVSGMRHAFEPDHLAAVSTLVADGHGGRRTAWLGAWWGIGHTTALLAVSVVVGALRAQIPPPLEQALEFGVALMLLALGVRAIRRGVAEMQAGPDEWHEHRGHTHHHPARGAHLHVGGWVISPRSLAIGIVHGLAGSGSLVALTMSELPSMPARLLFVALFGFGSVVSMAVLTGVAGGQLARVVSHRSAHARLQIAAGVLSLVIGGLWALPIAREVHWFTGS